MGSFGAARAQPAPERAAGGAAHAVPDRTEARTLLWKDSFDAFAAADRLHAPQPGGVLFVGSSSIRMWNGLADDFQSLPVITQRGFGGSRLSDCADQVERLVLPYRPAVIVLYAGDNDLAEGASPRDVLASFRRFVDTVHGQLPATRIAYVSIKPSPLRAALIPQILETNALIAAYTGSVGRLDFIDVYSKMLDAYGRPRTELFGPDMLHMSRAGYALWRTEIDGHLQHLVADAGRPDATAAVAPPPGAR